MRKISLLLFLVFIILFACKKNDTEPESEESNYKTFYGSIGNNDNSTIVSSDDHLIICGMNYEYDWSLIKTTKSGQQVWRRDLSINDIQFNDCSITEVTNGDLFVCGDTERNMEISGKDILLVKTNPFGDTIWTKTYGTSNDDHGQNIISTSDGRILISGFTIDSDSIASTDIYLLKLETNGDTLWTRHYMAPGIARGFHLLETNNGEYLITGSTIVDGSLPKLYMLKVDANGTKTWDNENSPKSRRTGRSTIELSNGDLLICGDSIGYDMTSQIFLMKTDNMGNKIWSRGFGDEYHSEYGNSIKQNQDGSFTIAGNTGDPLINIMTEIVLLKVDQSGNQIWLEKFGGPGIDKGSNLIKDANDDNLITGNLAIDDKVHIFLTRSDSEGNFR